MNACLRGILTIIISACLLGLPLALPAQPLFDKGWQALLKDNDTLALRLFAEAYLEAYRKEDTLGKAQSLLYMGICSYGVSYSKGAAYCYRAMDEYKKMEQRRPAKALEGRSRCLLLLATIESRLGNTQKSAVLSYEALAGFRNRTDTTHSLGLIYANLGNICKKRGDKDSAAYYFQQALAEQLRAGDVAYLPNAYLNLAKLQTDQGNQSAAFELFDRSLAIADSTANRQAQVYALLGRAYGYHKFGPATAEEQSLLQAEQIAATLSDQAFSLQTHQRLLDFYKARGDYKRALYYQESTARISDSMYSWDRQKEIRDLDIQYNVAETERQLKTISSEREIARLTNYMLWGGIVALVLLFAWVIITLRRINKRDKLLLQTKEALVQSTEQQKLILEEQKVLKEKQMQQELEFKESQLTAMTLQMMQKNELMQELKSRLEEDKAARTDHGINKIINKGLNQDKEWSDFNLYFESMNQHFYGRLKQAYPEISPNDLKICALIKLHLSIKEMATILNISPDSVKTARYRLRKKLQLNNEDNLTDFIMTL